MYDNIDSLLDLIANVDQFWSTIEGAPYAHDESVLYVATFNDNDHLNNLTIPHPTKAEYWDGYFNLNDHTLWILSHSVLDNTARYNINANDNK